MENRNDKWIEERRKTIGGSDTPTILGINPFMSPLELWELKTGRRADREPTPAMLRGTYLEAIVAQLYTEKTARRLRRVRRQLRHPEHEWMTAHIDRELLGDERGAGILEIKCPGLQVFGKAKRQGLPQAYAVQLQHYLAVTGRKWGALAMFNAERWELIFFDLERDDELIGLIIDRDQSFYRCILEDTPPADNAQPVPELPPVEPSELITMESPEWKEAVERLLEAREIRTEADALEEEARRTVQQLMDASGAAVAEGAGARIYFRQADGRTTIDTKRLQRELPDVFAKYAKTGAPFKTFRPYFLRGEQ